MTRATSGPTSSGPFAIYDHRSSCWRTYEGTCPAALVPYSATWPPSGTTRGGRAYALPTSAPPTTAPASSSSLLPTPAAWDGARGPDYARMRRAASGGDDLVTTVARMLPTPNASDGQGGPRAVPVRRTSRGADHGPRLRDVAPTLPPTPWATDGTKGGPNMRGSSGDLMLPSAVMRLLPTPMARDGKGRDSSSRHGPPGLPEAMHRLTGGASTPPPSTGGNGSSADPPPTPP